MAVGIWTFAEFAAASGGHADGDAAAPITGFSIDTRTLRPGEMFVALKDARDGHDFVSGAFAAGASSALVCSAYVKQPRDGPLVRVNEPLQGLESAARAARARLAPQARVIAVTGSVGKTGTKEMLRACLLRLGITHAADKSFNNHWGVPLTLVRMPAETDFGVFEIGMNHAGEIRPLTRMVRPHVAIVTTVEPVHLEYFNGVEEIAEAKAEIFEGLEQGGTAVLNRDNPHFGLLAARAEALNRHILTFGRHPASDVRPSRWQIGANGSEITVEARGRSVSYRLGAPGAHLAQNSLAVVATLLALGLDLESALAPLRDIAAPQGRGARKVLKVAGGDIMLIDESYNANPASMRAALAAMATVPRASYSRRIAVLGDMLELGPKSADLHAGLDEAVDAAGADLVFAAGPNMAHLYDKIPEHRRGAWGNTSDDIAVALVSALKPGDVIMIKGSLGSRMARLVEAVSAHAGAGV